MLLVLSLVAGLIAFYIGKWRSYCIAIKHLSARPAAYLPALWGPCVRMISWMLVLFFSLAFSIGIATLIRDAGYPKMAGYSWGMLLALRWLLSSQAGIGEAKKDLSDSGKHL